MSLINRQDAIEALDKDPMGGLNYNRILNELPSAQKTGHWGKYKEVLPEGNELFSMVEAPHGKMFCSNCEKFAYPTDYCPHCGAYMKGEQDERL